MDFAGINYNNPASFFRAIGAGTGPGSLPMPKMITASEVRQQAREMSESIFKNWKLRGDILDRHQATIQKRWAKKTKNQRVEILLAAWPKMSTQHRPDFAAFRKESPQQRDAGTKFKDAYMWPSINLEDLSKPKILPLLLTARARNAPDAFAFAFADADMTHLGIVSEAIVPAFLNQHVMMFTNRKTPQSYGELIPWDDHEDAFDWLHTGKGVHPGEGLIILEIQQRVMSFLVECCQRIMHDIPSAKLTSDEHPLQEPPHLASGTEDGFASLAVMAAEAPYRAPAHLDLARLESLFTAKQSSTEDHIWALREDPAYYRNTLLEYKEHRQEMMKDTKGNEHPVFKFHREEVFWQRVIGNVTCEANLGLEVWRERRMQITELRHLHAKHVANISPNEDLPSEYLRAILRMRHYLEQVAKGPLAQLKHNACASPSLRSWFVREPPPDSTTSMIRVMKKSNLNLSRVEGEFLWLMRVLWEDGHDLFLVRLSDVMDELQRLIQSSKEGGRLVSSYLAGVFGNLAIITEALRQLRIYQPWAQTFENAFVDYKDDIAHEFAENTKHWASLLNVATGLGVMGVVRLGDPSGARFDYPIDKPFTKKNVEAMRTAEKNLDDFWKAFDRDMTSRAADALKRTALQSLLGQPRILRRTAPWDDSDDGAKDNPMGTGVDNILKPLSELYFELEYCTERMIDRSQKQAPTTKKKTRGFAVPDGTNDPVQVADSPSTLPDVQPVFYIDARAHKVFRTLFYTPSQHSTPGEVPWNDFLHAMVSVGFVPEQLYGSVWHFQPTKLDVERSIQFHEPHPVAKLPYWQARRFGRRLERAYGWVGSMFQLAGESAGNL